MSLPELTTDTVDLVKKWEGLRLSPYLCSAGVPTIGYGATFLTDGSKVTLQTPAITRDEAERLLMMQLAIFRRGVANQVRVQLNANQAGALISFAFNLGLGRLQSSTLLRRVNQGDFMEAANQFMVWVNAGGRRLQGLVNRRTEEREMFLRPVIAVTNSAPVEPPQPNRVSRFLTAFRAGREGRFPDSAAA